MVFSPLTLLPSLLYLLYAKQRMESRVKQTKIYGLPYLSLLYLGVKYGKNPYDKVSNNILYRTVHNMLAPPQRGERHSGIVFTK